MRKLLTIQEACARLGVKVDTLRAWRRDGVNGTRLRDIRAGGVVWIAEEDLDAFVDELRDASVDSERTASA